MTARIVSLYEVHPNMVTKWKKELQKQSASIFVADYACKKNKDKKPVARLCRHMSFSVVRQHELFAIIRSGLYYQPKVISEEALALVKLINWQYLLTPFFGWCKMTIQPTRRRATGLRRGLSANGTWQQRYGTVVIVNQNWIPPYFVPWLVRIMKTPVDKYEMI